MKNTVNIFIVTLLCLLVSTAAWAASLTETSITDYQGFSIHNFTMTLDSGGVSSKAVSYNINGSVICVDTNPGTTAPSDNYDIKINNAAGIDIMGATMQNRDTANSERAYPAGNSVTVQAPTTGILTFYVENNLVENATVQILIWTRDEKKGVLSW